MNDTSLEGVGQPEKGMNVTAKNTAVFISARDRLEGVEVLLHY